MDLPALGNPTRPTSASSFNSSRRCPLFAGLPFFGFARGLMPGLGEVLIAAPAAPALRDQHALPGPLSRSASSSSPVSIEDHRADRNLQDHVVAGVAGAIRTFAVPPAVGLEFAIVAVAQQRVVVGIRFQINAAAVAAVAAEGPPRGTYFSRRNATQPLPPSPAFT